MMMKLVENDLYYFDEKAAARAERFIETRLCHYEDRWAGAPFILLDWERKLVRDVFGWKRRDNHLRRFREVYLEIAKGNGKSPLLAAIGCYLLLADNEKGARVISAATDFQQANVTFDSGKRMLQHSPRLLGMVQIRQFDILAPNDSIWEIVSGEYTGKAGKRPTGLLMDEAHEWKNRKLYDAMTKNAGKRSQPLTIVATNSGQDKETTICGELHKRAARVLAGTSKDDTLYAVIYDTDENDDIGDPKTWTKANPALGQIITIETLQSEYLKTIETPALEPEFRRLHLSQWVKGASKWLDMQQWEKCTKPFKQIEMKGMPLVLALDMSMVNDLCALSSIWIGEKRLFARARFWLPKKTADHYEERESIPYTQWERDGFIKLVNRETIDPTVHARIAKVIIGIKEKYGKDFKCLAYDRNRANNVIALCEAAGVVCVPVPQNWALSPAAEELTRRLLDDSIQFAPNPVLKWHASNVEAIYDKKGNIHIIKEGRNGSYKGRMGCKIDGIAALVTGLSQVLREQMQQPAKPSVYESRGVFSV